mmetsp:Transcript_74902/g.216559  ORF Transcript_74902/g.216559 Transcript_74902/m.216559 type:complete len:193 (-) Transcript_74902:64-642(-)
MAFLSANRKGSADRAFSHVEDTAAFKPERYRRQGVNERDILEMKASFDLLDYSGKGQLDLDDVIDELQSFKIERLEQEPLMIAVRACRRRGTTADFGAFVDAMAPLLTITEPSEEALRRAWRLMDDSRRGVITLEDLTRVANKFEMQLTQEEVIDMVEFADRDSNGEVSFDEFQAAVANPDRMGWAALPPPL